MERSNRVRAFVPIACAALSLFVLVNVSLMSGSVNSSSSAISEAPLVGQYDVEYTASEESSGLVSPGMMRRLPGCLIIGVRKGGTRALLDALALHPRVRIARREVHFFNSNSTYANGLEWYRHQMPASTANQVTVEKTPAYFTNEFAAERAKRMNASLKLILILRNPVTRTISDFTQVVCTKEERNKSLPNFETFAFLADGRSIDEHYKPVRNSLYSLHMHRWLAHFPLHNFLIVDGDRFIVDPLSELRRVERFLGLGESIEKNQLVFNRRKGFYCFRRKERAHARCLGSTKGRAHVNISEDTQAKLRDNFRPYNKELFKMVNQWWIWE